MMVFSLEDYRNQIAADGGGTPQSQRASSRATLCLPGPKHKVPRPNSGAEDCAPSLTGARDDDLFSRR